MKKRFFSFTLLILITVCLSLATFVEDITSSAYASRLVYRSGWFITLWAALVITCTLYIYKQKLYKQVFTFLIHVSLMVILVGALLTYLTGVKGDIHIREGCPENSFINEDANRIMRLPFAVALDSFQIEHYPGTDAPSDYISFVKFSQDGVSRHERVSMNNIATYQGYRFYQSSYDPDLKGTVLSVNRDPYGIFVTYTGYILLFISVLLYLFSRRSSFRALLHHPLLKSGMLLLLFSLITPAVFSQPTSLDAHTASTWGRVSLLYNHRISPVETLAKDFTHKLTGGSSYRDYSPTQVLAGFLFYPEEWRNEPLILLKNEELSKILQVNEIASLSDFFTTDGNYKLAQYQSDVYRAGKLSTLERAIRDADEKVQLIIMLQNRNLLTLFPARSENRIRWFSPRDKLPTDISQEDRLFIKRTFPLLQESVKNGKQEQILHIIGDITKYQSLNAPDQVLSTTRLQAEHLLNEIDFSTILYRFNLVMGILAVFCFCRSLLLNKLLYRLSALFTCLLGGAWLFQSAGLLLRMYVGNRQPLSNGYETMLFVAWCVMTIALLFRKKTFLILAFGFILSGFTLLVASLGQMNPQITPLMPVLLSPWLSVHVSLIMIAYALCGFILLNGLTALVLSCWKRSESVALMIQRLEILSRLFLYPAVFFLGLGIFVGAVWANVSWGRYWGWDPKEVWALITFLIYSFPFHRHSLILFRKPLFFHLYSVLAFASVLMTYFGVNYLLGGMHSYGG